MANSYSRCQRQLVEPAAVRVPAETVEWCLPVNAKAAGSVLDFVSSHQILQRATWTLALDGALDARYS